MSADEERRAWALALMSRANGRPPAYGSPEWLALPDGPEKVAAVVRAAETLVIERALRDAEIEAWRKAAEDVAWQAARDRHKAAWDAQRGRFRPDPAIATEVEQEWREWVGEAG